MTYDRRGRGESGDTPPYAVEREVDDLRALAAAGPPAALYGFSSGAALALRAAVRGLPVTGLALLEPPVELAGPSPDDPDLGAEVNALVAAGRRGAAVEHFTPPSASRPSSRPSCGVASPGRRWRRWRTRWPTTPRSPAP